MSCAISPSAASIRRGRRSRDFLTVAQRASGVPRSATAAPQGVGKTVSAHVLTYTERNVNAAFDLAQKLVRAKDPQEALALQSEYLKTQLAVLQEQAKELRASPKEHRLRLARLELRTAPFSSIHSPTTQSIAAETSRLFMAPRTKEEERRRPGGHGYDQVRAR